MLMITFGHPDGDNPKRGWRGNRKAKALHESESTEREFVRRRPTTRNTVLEEAARRLSRQGERPDMETGGAEVRLRE